MGPLDGEAYDRQRPGPREFPGTPTGRFLAPTACDHSAITPVPGATPYSHRLLVGKKIHHSERVCFAQARAPLPLPVQRDSPCGFPSSRHQCAEQASRSAPGPGDPGVDGGPPGRSRAARSASVTSRRCSARRAAHNRCRPPERGDAAATPANVPAPGSSALRRFSFRLDPLLEVKRTTWSRGSLDVIDHPRSILGTSGSGIPKISLTA